MNKKRQEAIEFIEEAKRIHQKFVDILNDVPEVIDTVKQGGKEWHKIWVDRYNLVLEILREER